MDFLRHSAWNGFWRSVRRHQAAEIFHTARLTALGFSLLGTLMTTAGGMRWLIAVAVNLLMMSPVKFIGGIFQVEMKLWYTVGIGLIHQLLWLPA